MYRDIVILIFLTQNLEFFGNGTFDQKQIWKKKSLNGKKIPQKCLFVWFPYTTKYIGWPPFRGNATHVFKSKKTPYVALIAYLIVQVMENLVISYIDILQSCSKFCNVG
jgi:hypothetical protein